jgi:rod shape-determining protein MreC
MWTREASSEKKVFILIIVLFLNLFIMSFNIILKNEKSLIENIMATLFSPIQVGFQKSIDFLSYEFKHYIFLKNMYHQYHELKKKHKQLKYENYLLRKNLKQLEFSSRVTSENPDFMGAEVISVDNNFPFSNIYINKGSSQGIKKNQVLLNEDGELVGRVIDPITTFSAKVRLITSSTGGVGAYIKKNRLEGLLTGSNQKICQFKYLMENAPVSIGDEVITSGTDQLFSPYLPIGKVVGIEREYLTQTIFVKPFFIEKSINQLIIMMKPLKKGEK